MLLFVFMILILQVTSVRCELVSDLKKAIESQSPLTLARQLRCDTLTDQQKKEALELARACLVEYEKNAHITAREKESLLIVSFMFFLLSGFATGGFTLLNGVNFLCGPDEARGKCNSCGFLSAILSFAAAGGAVFSFIELLFPYFTNPAAATLFIADAHCKSGLNDNLPN